MSVWFAFTLVSVVFAGLHIFMQKVAVMRGYSSSLINSYSSLVAAVLGFIVAFFYEGFSELSWPMVGIAMVAGLVFIVGANLRMDGLRYIDATILLPLHKFVSPLAALVIGLVIFKETLTAKEWVGITLGILVPLLLVTQAENARQSNLKKGLILIVMSAVLAAVAVAINKYSADIFYSVLLYMSIKLTFSATVSGVQYRYRRGGAHEEETHHFDLRLLGLSLFCGVMHVISFSAVMLAFKYGGPLAVVYTINSLYILIPIVLSIIFFAEHWNARKAIAIIVSLGAVVLMK